MNREERREEIIRRLKLGEELEEIYANCPEISKEEMEADRRFFIRTNIIAKADIEGKNRQRARMQSVKVKKDRPAKDPINSKKVEKKIEHNDPEGPSPEEIRAHILEHFTDSTNEQMGVALGLETHEIAAYRKQLIQEGLMKRHKELLEERREKRRKRSQELMGKVKVNCIAARLGINPETVYKVLNIRNRRQIPKPNGNPEDPVLKMSPEELENAGKKVRELNKSKEYREALDVIDDILTFGGMEQNQMAILEEIKRVMQEKENRRKKELRATGARSLKTDKGAKSEVNLGEIEWINGDDRI